MLTLLFLATVNVTFYLIDWLQTHIGVKGFVIDAVWLKVIPNSLITVRGINKTVTAASYGDYWRLLVPGIYTISAWAPG